MNLMTLMRLWCLEFHPNIGHATVNAIIDASQSAGLDWLDWLLGKHFYQDNSLRPLWPRLMHARDAVHRPQYAHLFSHWEASLDDFSNIITLMSMHSSSWPSQLQVLDRAIPPVLGVLGDCSLLGYSPHVYEGIIGPRDPSKDGLNAAQILAEKLVDMGRIIISGGARGIDQHAVHAALEAHGSAIVIIPASFQRAMELLEAYPRSGRVAIIVQFPSERGGNYISRCLIRNKTIAAWVKRLWVTDWVPSSRGTGRTLAQANAFGKETVAYGNAEGLGSLVCDDLRHNFPAQGDQVPREGSKAKTKKYIGYPDQLKDFLESEQDHAVL